MSGYLSRTLSHAGLAALLFEATFKSKTVPCVKTCCIGLILIWLLFALRLPCQALAPAYITDAELADMPIVVVAHWDKAPLDAHTHTRNEAELGKVIDQYEIRTELVVDRTLKGDVSPGRHKLLFGFGVGWSKNGKEVRSYTSTNLSGDVDDVTKPTLWFLSSAHSWDKTDATTYLAVKTYRCIQPLELEPYYRVLMRPDRENAVADLLASSDEKIVAHCLRFICREREPWPFASFLDDFFRPPDLKEKPLIQHAQRIGEALDHMPLSQRPYAVAVYALLLGRDSVEKMRSLLNDKDPMVRAIAVGVLTQFRDTSSVNSFRDALTGVQNGSVGCAIIKRMAAWGDERLVPALISFLQDDSDGGMSGDDVFVPALKARRALLKMTAYAFPYDVRASQETWATAQHIREPTRRKQYLSQHLGNGRPPLEAHVVRGRRTAVVVTNVSSRAMELARTPEWIAISAQGSSEGFAPGEPNALTSFVTLQPGARIYVPIQLDPTFLLSEPKSRKVLLVYTRNGNKQGRHAWMGTLSPTFGHGWKEPKRVRRHVVRRWPSGKVREQGWTINGHRNGTWRYYREDGRRAKDIEYVFGSEGGSTIYNPDYTGNR